MKGLDAIASDVDRGGRGFGAKKEPEPEAKALLRL
jgi:hypothetical protein